MEETQLLNVLVKDHRFQEISQEEEVPRYMCEVLDRIETRGIQKGILEGKIEGENLFASFLQKLIQNNQSDLIPQVLADKEYRHKLMAEMGLLPSDQIE